MEFLIDADLPYSLVRLIADYGHSAVHVRDMGLGAADDLTIAESARSHQRILLTGDFDFADIRNYPPRKYSGIVVLALTPTMVSTDIHERVRRFLMRADIVSNMPQALAIVERDRVRVRR